MSKALPLTTDLRESHYLAQTGRSELTPAQARRMRHKQNEAARVVPVRIGRLRRRFDRKDQREVTQTSRQVVGLIRARISYSRFTPKPSSKRQRAMFRRTGDR